MLFDAVVVVAVVAVVVVDVVDDDVDVVVVVFDKLLLVFTVELLLLLLGDADDDVAELAVVARLLVTLEAEFAIELIGTATAAATELLDELVVDVDEGEGESSMGKTI